ncbi:MAG: cation transporter [Clostridia bacterium]|nr:cation transporter [Clostridia bacterium]
MLFGKKKDVELKIDGMHCEKCVARVTDALKALGCKADVSLAEGLAKVKCPAKIPVDKLIEAVSALGFTASAK